MLLRIKFTDGINIQEYNLKLVVAFTKVSSFLMPPTNLLDYFYCNLVFTKIYQFQKGINVILYFSLSDTYNCFIRRLSVISKFHMLLSI